MKLSWFQYRAVHGYGTRNSRTGKTKLLKTIVHINFIIVGLLIAFIFSYRLVRLSFISYIEVYFTFALLDCVPYNEDFVKSRFSSLYRGSVPYILLQFWPGWRKSLVIRTQGLRYKGPLNRGSTVFISNKFSDLFIWYRIKDVIDFFGIFNLHRNRMWKFWLIVAERFVKLLKDKLVHHAPVSLNKTRSYIFHIGCKAFIKPKIIPPFHSDEVSKPLQKKIKTKICIEFLLRQSSKVSKNAFTNNCTSGEKEVASVKKEL